MASKNNGLLKLVKDLKKVRNNIETLTKKKKDTIIAHAMKNIGILTAYDTGVARGVIQNILRRELKRPDLAVELDHTVYNYWEKRYGIRTPDMASYTFTKTPEGKYVIVIDDDGFAGQALDGKVSMSHPRNDSLITPRQVDYVCDMMNAGMIDDIEQSIDDLTTTIIKAIETGRVRGMDKL